MSEVIGADRTQLNRRHKLVFLMLNVRKRRVPVCSGQTPFSPAVCEGVHRKLWLCRAATQSSAVTHLQNLNVNAKHISKAFIFYWQLTWEGSFWPMILLQASDSTEHLVKHPKKKCHSADDSSAWSLKSQRSIMKICGGLRRHHHHHYHHHPPHSWWRCQCWLNYWIWLF